MSPSQWQWNFFLSNIIQTGRQGNPGRNGIAKLWLQFKSVLKLYHHYLLTCTFVFFYLSTRKLKLDLSKVIITIQNYLYLKKLEIHLLPEVNQGPNRVLIIGSVHKLMRTLSTLSHSRPAHVMSSGTSPTI